MSLSSRIAVLSISALLSSGIGTAAQVIGSTGLVAPAFTQTFESPVTTVNSQIGSQFGTLTSDTLFYDANPSCAYYGEGGNCVSNFQYISNSVKNIQDTFSIFLGTQTYAAFAIVTGGGPAITFSAMYQGTIVDSFTTSINNDYAGPGAGNYYGFSGETFDTLQVSTNSASTLAVIDNVQFSNTAPEPATVLLFGAGLAGLGFFGRRRRSA